MPGREKVLIFDFDGTISLGDGPVRSYARHVAQSLSMTSANDFLASVEVGLEGELPDLDMVDGYDLVRQLSDRFGASIEARSRAFLLSREELATDAAPITAPAGIIDFLAAAHQHAHLVLATNSPHTRIDAALESLGVAGYFDSVHTSVGKPAGLEAIVDEWLTRFADVDPAVALLSVGDIWVNDLEPAHLRDASTALVAARADHMATTNGATPTFSATSLQELYSSLNGWLESTVPPAVSPHRSTSVTFLPYDQR